MRVRRIVVAALGSAAVLAVALAEHSVAARPVLPLWAEEIHPLLGAAPLGCFAREPDADPWADFRGRTFARSRGSRERVLLVGGVTAAALAPRIEAALAPRADLVVAAREGYGPGQALILVGRFAPALAVSRIALVLGDDQGREPPFEGWTPEWDWQAAAFEWPWGEVVARRSALVRGWLVPDRRRLVPPAEGVAAHEARLRSIAALARGRGLGLLWAPAAGRDASLLFEAGLRAIGDAGQAFRTPDDLASALERERGR